MTESIGHEVVKNFIANSLRSRVPAGSPYKIYTEYPIAEDGLGTGQFNGKNLPTWGEFNPLWLEKPPTILDVNSYFRFNGKSILKAVVADIVILWRDRVVDLIEVEHTHPLDKDPEKIELLSKYFAGIWRVKVPWFLGQIELPTSLPSEFYEPIPLVLPGNKTPLPPQAGQISDRNYIFGNGYLKRSKIRIEVPSKFGTSILKPTSTSKFGKAMPAK